MEHREQGAPLLGELAHQIEEHHLVAQVEEARRLVEGQRRRLLGERARHHHALPLAGGELVDQAVGERESVDPRQRRARDRDVALGFEGDPGEVRVAAEQHRLERGEGHLEARLLGHHGEPARDLPARQRRQRIAAQLDRSELRGERAREQPDQRRLARAVGPDDAQHLARLDREGERLDAAAARVAEAEVAHGDAPARAGDRRALSHAPPRAGAAAPGRRARRRAR